MNIAFSLDLSMEWITSLVMTTPSRICLPITKPSLSSRITKSSYSLSLSSITFDMILYAMLQKEMGLNKSKDLKPSHLGISAKKVAFLAFNICLFL